ncbi:FitA-like ribbon-helix-helix domain-containing protein [Agromyces atrinae]|uniref:Plasmid stability protein n=1 Tax=Agromyces atrinae TaxID=592376 RepID=A0A4Q2M650_9MICO|nr:plasmid stabilization protein [Agromyces atrinae]NYD68207.1 plasmid stability protein [Agromyces atrinae]RXZ87654.1 plasmid stabilization protein [Agromyces atrinae]
MATITVRGLDEVTKARLRVRAAENGRSTEAEVRAILDAAVASDSGRNALGSRLEAILGGLEPLEIPARAERPRSADLA